MLCLNLNLKNKSTSENCLVRPPQWGRLILFPHDRLKKSLQHSFFAVLAAFICAGFWTAGAKVKKRAKFVLRALAVCESPCRLQVTLPTPVFLSSGGVSMSQSLRSPSVVRQHRRRPRRHNESPQHPAAEEKAGVAVVEEEPAEAEPEMRTVTRRRPRAPKSGRWRFVVWAGCLRRGAGASAKAFGGDFFHCKCKKK